MISGYNTDIKFGGVTYHIQTEDKGLRTPLILSLVYQGGTILASKRSPYDDLIEAGIVESALEDRVARQHKLICAAVKAGRIEDLKRMTMKESAESPAGLVARKQGVVSKKSKPAPVTTEEVTVPSEAKEKLPVLPVEEPDLGEETVWEIPLIEGVEVIENTALDGNVIIEEEIILPPEAVKVISELESLNPWAENELKVKILGNEIFYSGEQKNINVLVCRGKNEVAVAGAGIMIKVLGSDFRPQIFHSVADSNGVAAISVTVPDFRSGRAAVLVRAMVGNEEAEIRRAISQKD